MPLLLISITKYIANSFDIRFYATVYALSANFSKQISVFIMSSIAGGLYSTIGFQLTYLLMGSIVFLITIFTMIFLKPIKNKY